MEFSNLENLGFNDWFQNELDSSKLNDFQLARVTTVHKESYIITNGEWQTRAEVTGKIMFSADSPLDYPTVGDWCLVQYFDKNSPAIIHEILPRKSILKRKTSGKKVEFQAIASNIDYALIVQSLNADFNLRRLERYLVMVREGNIEPVFLLSKSDLLSTEEVNEKKNEILESIPNIQVIAFSNTENESLTEIEKLLTFGKTFCLLGSSGVGKTSLLNNLVGEEVLATKEIREKDSKGKHTTTHRQLLSLENGSMIIDTPGMRELGNIGVESGLEEVFDDITELETQCKFSDCTHTQEIGCAILDALDDGTISAERFQNYVKMQKESEHNEMSYLEKRKKFKAQGKLYKSIQQHNRKNKSQ
jgi:ribosome biogenesis GTPase